LREELESIGVGRPLKTREKEAGNINNRGLSVLWSHCAIYVLLSQYVTRIFFVFFCIRARVSSWDRGLRVSIKKPSLSIGIKRLGFGREAA